MVDTTTFEVNLISNEPLMDGKLDWTVGAFFMEHEIENIIRGYVDEIGVDDNNGVLIYDCRESFANPNYCYDVNGPDPWFFFEFDFVTDTFPTRESFSVYAQTTYSFSDQLRLISGLRYIDDEVESCVKNFLQQFVITFQVAQMKLLEKLLLNMISMDQQWVMPHIQLDPNQAEQTLLMVLVPEKSLMLISDLHRQ